MLQATLPLQPARQLIPANVLIPLQAGATAGILALYAAAVGILKLFSEREVIVDAITLGHVFLVTLTGACGAYVWKTSSLGFRGRALQTLLAGLIAGLCLTALIFAMANLNLRWIFTALSNDLLRRLTGGHTAWTASLAILAASMAAAATGALIMALPRTLRRGILWSLAAVLIAGVFQELIQMTLRFGWPISAIRSLLYVWGGLTSQGAVIVFAVAFVACFLLNKRKARDRAKAGAAAASNSRNQLRSAIILIAALVVFPFLAGSFIGQVMMLISLFVLMGMGLNIEVGLAGLLDMGFVAFFAVGSYTMALLTADSEYALASYTFLPALNFWMALPFAVLAATIVR